MENIEPNYLCEIRLLVVNGFKSLTQHISLYFQWIIFLVVDNVPVENEMSMVALSIQDPST